MKIEILYFEGCPNHRPAAERVQAVLREEGITAEVAEVSVADEAAARLLGFLGSPTIRVNGLDVEPAARASKEFGMMCRTYVHGGKREGLPPTEWIRQALREACPAVSAVQGCSKPAPSVPGPSGSKPKRFLLGASVVAAIAASLCCILPIVAAVTGAGVLAAGAAFERWRPYLLGAAGVLLAGGLLLAYRDHRKACEPGSVCAARPGSRWNLMALGILALLVIGLAAFPYYSGSVASAVVRRADSSMGSAALATATFRIPDMDCPACAVSLSARLGRLPGVAGANVDFESRRAVVTYHPGRQDFAAFQKIVNEAGFRVEPDVAPHRSEHGREGH